MSGGESVSLLLGHARRDVDADADYHDVAAANGSDAGNNARRPRRGATAPATAISLSSMGTSASMVMLVLAVGLYVYSYSTASSTTGIVGKSTP
jgi:hypothetical protein